MEKQILKVWSRGTPSGISSYKPSKEEKGEGVSDPRWGSFSPTLSPGVDPVKPKVTEATADRPSVFELADAPGHEGTGQILGTNPENHCGPLFPVLHPSHMGTLCPGVMWVQAWLRCKPLRDRQSGKQARFKQEMKVLRGIVRKKKNQIGRLQETLSGLQRT